MISVLVIGSSILLWRKQSYTQGAARRDSRPSAGRAGSGNGGFRFAPSPALALVPVLAWAAFRIGMLATALTGVVIAAVGNFATGSHLGQLEI